MNFDSIDIEINGQRQPVYLGSATTGQRIHNRWWTALPAIPPHRDSLAYRRLYRQFADHTMNTFKNVGDIIKPGNRGFYIEGREDHLVPAFFENFALFPNHNWFQSLLTRLTIPFEPAISELAWTYSYGDVLPGHVRPRIADVVFMWRDAVGDGILVVEAKRAGCGPGGISLKDHPSERYYLQYPTMQGINRRHQALLIDEQDRRHLPDGMSSEPAVITWQELADVQLSSLQDVVISDTVKAILRIRVQAHHASLCIRPSLQLDASDKNPVVGVLPYNQDMERRPQSLQDWLIGSDVFFKARQPDAIVAAPYEWLNDEPTFVDFSRLKRQTTFERRLPLWMLTPALTQ